MRLKCAHPKGASSRILLSAVVPIPVQGTLPCGSYNLGLCLSVSLGLKYTSGAQSGLRFLSLMGKWMAHSCTWEPTVCFPPHMKGQDPPSFLCDATLCAAGPVSVHRHCPQVDSKSLGIDRVSQDPWVVCVDAVVWIQVTGLWVRNRQVGALTAEGRLVPPIPRGPLLTTPIPVSCSAACLGGKVRMLRFSALTRGLVVTAPGLCGPGDGAGSPAGSSSGAGPGAEGGVGACPRSGGAEGGDTGSSTSLAGAGSGFGAGPSSGSGMLWSSAGGSGAG